MTALKDRLESLVQEWDHTEFKRTDEEHEWVCTHCRRFTFGKARWPCASQRYSDKLLLTIDPALWTPLSKDQNEMDDN